GRFEGFDERIFAGRDVEEVSIGDIILSGGEPAAIMLLDACIRLLPGVMGAASSGDDESFENGLLDYPHYTRPNDWEGRLIPEVLRSGDHGKIAAWRKQQAADDTRSRRPDLWERYGGASAEEIAKALSASGKEIPEFRAGDTLRVGVKVIEGERTRVQAYEGVVIARSNRGINSNFTVRKISFGEGVERVFPLYSPNIESITVVQ
ncbi:hypothetical protein E4T56_gene9455, partial [Termitomyces sp. T112]